MGGRPAAFTFPDSRSRCGRAGSYNICEYSGEADPFKYVAVSVMMNVLREVISFGGTAMNSLRPLGLILLAVLGLAASAGMVPAQHSPCNPAVETCL